MAVPVTPVCLVVPPSTFLLDERVFVSLGVLRVAACLERAGVEVEVLDLSGVDDYVGAFDEHCARSGPRTFGFTATTPQLPATLRLLGVLTQRRPYAKTVLGGPHVTLVNAARKREEREGRVGRAHRTFHELSARFDVLVAGDGDDAVFEALREGAPKLVDADEPRSSLFLTNQRYEELPLPARHLVDLSTYRYEVDGANATSLIAQLGCPFYCGFCGGRNSPSLRRVRTRSTASVVAEVRHLHETYGYTGFMFYDDELNVNPRLVELADALSALQRDIGVELKLRGFVKAELFNERQAEALRRAGFHWLLVGFESGHPTVLESIQKRATREDNERCLRLARDQGLKVKALTSVGHPGESEVTVRWTRDWLLEQRVDEFDCTVITVYPGTPYYDEARESEPNVWTYVAPNGERLHSREVDLGVEAGYYKGAPGAYQAYVWTDHLASEELVALRDDLEATVRRELDLPYPVGRPGLRYEHSMGQSSELPNYVLRSTREARCDREDRGGQRVPAQQPLAGGA